MRSEDELRAAFQQKAAEAPQAADVLRAVRAREAAPRARRRWLMPAVAGAMAIAVGVPLGIALSHSTNTETKKSAGGAQPERAAAGGRGAQSSGAGGGQGSGGARAEPGPNQALVLPTCRRADVTVSVQSDALRITSHGTPCQLARVPSMRTGATPGSMPRPAAGTFGTLVPGVTASAPLRWTGSCGAPTAGVIRIDWGDGPVDVHVAGMPRGPCAVALVHPLHGLH